jgi:hypothetical protein
MLVANRNTQIERAASKLAVIAFLTKDQKYSPRLDVGRHCAYTSHRKRNEPLVRRFEPERTPYSYALDLVTFGPHVRAETALLETLRVGLHGDFRQAWYPPAGVFLIAVR